MFETILSFFNNFIWSLVKIGIEKNSNIAAKKIAIVSGIYITISLSALFFIRKRLNPIIL